MQSAIYNESLNDFSRKYLIKGNEHLVRDFNNFPIALENEISTIGERLLVHDSITFKVYGENIPLTILINKFGLKKFEELLEQDAIKFLLWNNDITYMHDNIKSLKPLQSLSYSSDVHSDPEKSIYYGMDFMKNPLPRRVRRDITKKVLKKYIVPSKQLAKDSVDFGHEGYENNLFKDLGLSNDKEIDSLNIKEKRLLIQLTNQCYTLALLSKYQLNIYNSPEILNLNRAEFNQLKNVSVLDEFVDTIFNFEKVPSFSEMIREGIIDIKDIPKMRNNRNAKEFRTWINNVSDENKDRDEILKEYMDANMNGKSIFDSGVGKLGRVFGVTTLGVVGSTFVDPVSGAIVSLGVSLLDSYIISALSKGWTPKYYIDKQIRSVI